jgi:polyisoprenoid-binding protein YceI
MSQQWNIDASHSSIDFKVRHMAISTVKGHFKSFSGSAQTDNGALQGLEVNIDANSITTNNDQRDGHLKSPDFFDTSSNPDINIKSTNVVQTAPNQYTITADMTMRGTTKPVTFKAELGETVKDPWGLQRSSANVSGKLNRKDWGVSWNQALDHGGVMVSDDVTFDFDVEMVAQA